MRSSGDVLKVVSMMAPNALPVHAAIADYLQRRGIPTRFVGEGDWRERQRMLLVGEAQLGFICGLPYVQEADRPHHALELLCAPVMRASRYRGRPVYFSDVVVRCGSPVRSFAHLRGAVWAYNEPSSHSGYNVARYHLARMGKRDGYFGRLAEAGSHQAALAMVLAGAVDAAAIDSTVLETELHAHPDLGGRIRVVETLGPSSIPPVVASTRLAEPLRSRIRQLLLEMHDCGEGRAILAEARIQCFVPRDDADYDDIRRMHSRARDVTLEAAPARQSSKQVTKTERRGPHGNGL